MTSDLPYTRLPRPTLWLVRGDTFVMGGIDGPGFAARVESFYISKTPVTNEEYEAFDPSHPRPDSSAQDRHPVVNVSFQDAVNYCRWYSAATGKNFRLPSEMEWEFACRAGTTTRYYWGDDPEQAHKYVWDAKNSDARCHEVEQLLPNQFGLYDLLGNVWEWTGSLLSPYPIEVGDGRDDPEASGPRVIRGGSCHSSCDQMGCAVRASLAPQTRTPDVGFRLVRPLR